METQHAIFGSCSHSAICGPILQIPTSAVARTKIRNIVLCNFIYATVASSHLGPHTHIIILFSITLSLCSSFTVEHQISYPCTTADRLTFVHTLILVLFRPVQLVVKVATLWLSPPKRPAGSGVHTVSYFMDVSDAFPRDKPDRS